MYTCVIWRRVFCFVFVKLIMINNGHAKKEFTIRRNIDNKHIKGCTDLAIL